MGLTDWPVVEVAASSPPRPLASSPISQSYFTFPTENNFSHNSQFYFLEKMCFPSGLLRVATAGKRCIVLDNESIDLKALAIK